MLEKTLESSLDSKEIKPVSPKGNQPWIFIERIDAETEAPIVWLPDAKSWLTRKDPDAGKIEDRRKRRWQRMRWLDGSINSMDVSLSNPWEIVKDREAWHASIHGVAKRWTWLSDWTTTTNNTSPYSHGRVPIYFMPTNLSIKNNLEYEVKITLYTLSPLSVHMEGRK